MHLVIDKVVQLQIVDVSAEYRIDERDSCPSVVECGLRCDGQSCFLHLVLDLLHACALEDR